MDALPLLSRVTEAGLTGSLQSSIQRALQGLAREEERIASGRQHQTLADAPLVTRRIVSLTGFVERQEKFQANISLGSSRLGATESALAEMQNQIIRAREIALSQIDASATDETRSNSAVEVSAILSEMVTLANRQFSERYLFGGSLVDAVPFERTGSFVSYRGDDLGSSVEIAAGVFAADAVNGVRGFGAWSSEIRGRSDLTPAVELSTQLSSLNGGRGVQLGGIRIFDGVGSSQVIDLAGTHTIGDVIERINAGGFVTASINGAANGLSIALAGANLTIQDYNGGRAATDLGIVATAAGATVTGADIDSRIAATTSLAALRGGAGIPVGDFTIQNGNLAATISTAGLATVEDLLNEIQRAGVAVVARLNGDATGIDLFSKLSGADFTVTEGSGTTANDLGLIIPSAEIPLARLNGGRGVHSIEGDDVSFTLGDGSVIAVDIASAATLGDVAALINADAENGGSLFAEVVSGEDRLRLTDLSGGAAEMTVAAINGSFTATGLGIAGTSAGGVLEGQGLDPGALRVNSVFDGLSLLQDALAGSDVALMTRALDALDEAETRLLDTRADIGSSMRRLEISERRTELEILETRDLLSREGDTDLAETILKFRREESVLQASLQTAARLMQQTILDFLG